MRSFTILAGLAALNAAYAQTVDCDDDIEITAADQMIDCTEVDGSITISSDVVGDVMISGPRQISGDLIVNGSNINSIQSTSVNSIGGMLELSNLESLTSINMPSLRSVGEISFTKLPKLSDLTFGAEGLTSVDSITITDTFLNTLTGLNVATVNYFRIESNRRLAEFDSDLVNITEAFIVNRNGQDMVITMDQLESAADIQISSVKSFEVPLLKTVNNSISIIDNENLESFSAPNLTKLVQDASFRGNPKLANISMPLLEEISGGLTIFKNAALTEINGFPKLETVSGGMNLTGDFEEVDLPSLNDVKGSVYVISSTDISDFCDFFEEAQSDGRIQGEAECESDAPEAASDSEGDGTGSGGSGDDDDSAAGISQVNMAVLGLAAVAGLAQFL